MSMILASTAREIHRSRLFDEDNLSSSPSKNESNEFDGRMHYGRALSSLRHALKQDVKTPQKIEAVFITLWLMIDYENRFGSGITAIKIHVRGVETLLHNHIVPLLQTKTAPQRSSPSTSAIAAAPEGSSPGPQTQPDRRLSLAGATLAGGSKDIALPDPHESLRSTSVPLFLLWTLYFFTPSALFFGPGTTRLDTDIYQFFLDAENGNADHLSLPELYRISRQSPARFWGGTYPQSAQLDDMENLPGLTLYHHSHVIQFKITELFKQSVVDEVPGTESPHHQLIDQINTLSVVCIPPQSFDRALTKTGIRYGTDDRQNLYLMRNTRRSPCSRNSLLVHHNILQHDCILPPLLPRKFQQKFRHSSLRQPHDPPRRCIPSSRAELETPSQPAALDGPNHLAVVPSGHCDFGPDLPGLGGYPAKGTWKVWREFYAN